MRAGAISVWIRLYRECHPRALCHAQHCGLRDHLNDDLDVVTLSGELIAAPPIELWPGNTAGARAV